MENIYFKGLQKALDEDCYISVFSSVKRYPVVRVEKKDKETGKEQLISYAENGNVISALNSASNKIIDEVSDVDDDKIWCESVLIDRVIENGFTLHFFKLSNNQILSTICANSYQNFIPVKSIITDDIKSGFETLNSTLETFDFDKTDDFYDFVESQTAPVVAYQKKLNQKNKTNK